MLRQIAFEEPQPPRRINRAIPAELEIIVLKAMEKNPADRYATAQELADDLRRWLEDRPIQARRPGMVRRVRSGAEGTDPVWSAAAVLLVAYAGLIVASALLANANQSLKSTNAQLDAANRSLTSERSERTNFELDLARQDAVNSKHYQDAVNGQQPYEVRMFMQDSEQPYEVRMFLQNALLPQGEPTDQVGRLLWFGPRLSNVAIPTIKELLDRAAAELTPEKIEQEFPQQPLVQAEILHTVGIAYLYVGDFAKAVAHLERRGPFTRPSSAPTTSKPSTLWATSPWPTRPPANWTWPCRCSRRRTSS